MRKFYAEVATWGSDKTTVIQFDSRKERDEFVEQDCTNKVSSKEAEARGYIHINEHEKAYEEECEYWSSYEPR